MVRFDRRHLRAWVVGVLLACMAVAGVSAAKKSDKEQAGLLGPVRSVTWYYAECWEQSGQWVEGPRKRERDVKYDRSGRMIELVFYEDDGSVRSEQTWKYDEKGRLVQESSEDGFASTTSYEYDNDGRIANALKQTEVLGSERAQYRYDSKGNLVEEAWYYFRSSTLPDGTLSTRDVFKYDDKGNRIEEATYGGDGRLRSRTRYKYDAQGNEVEYEYSSYGDDGSVDSAWKYVRRYDTKGNITALMRYGTDGLLDYKETYKLDTRGNVVELLHYDRDGSLTQEYTFDYIFDSHGNWIKRTRLMRVTKAGKSFWAPKDVRYRTITYY